MKIKQKPEEHFCRSVVGVALERRAARSAEEFSVKVDSAAPVWGFFYMLFRAPGSLPGAWNVT